MATTIAELNRQVTVRHYLTFKNGKGIPQKALDTSQVTYAKAEQISNSYLLEQMKVNFGEAWRFTLRWEISRILYPTDDILYNGKAYIINGIVNNDEGKKRWTVVTAAISNNTGATTTIPPLSIQTEWHSKGNVTIGGDAYKNWNGKILSYRDGLQYLVKRDGSAAGKEVNYDYATGLFTFPSSLPDLIDGEPVDIYFL